MLGSDLIEGPDIEHQPEPDHSDSRGLMGRFRRRKTDRAAEEEGTSELPAPDVTIVGGESRPEAFDDPETFDPLQPPPPMTPEAEESDPTPQEHSSAAAILEQLREQEGAEDDDVWMPPAAAESTTWTLPEITQSPLGGAGPWESVAHTADPDTNETPADEADEFEPPVFVSEAELRSQGPADTDQTGNWVPPTLRGMAPQAGHNAAELPRRRRQNSPES
ncbi:MAG: hypothetical protein KJN63_07070 [Acidimicrobiia bacterium]|nr:hypothetical protein [Acidimicrobiia bacterium]